MIYVTSDHCSKQPDCRWASLGGRGVVRAGYCSWDVFCSLWLLLLCLSPTWIFLGGLIIIRLKSLRVVVFLLLKIPGLQRGFWWWVFFFSSWSFFCKPLCRLVVAMQSSLLSPRELSIPVSGRHSNKQRFCNLKAEHSAFWTKSTSLGRACR